MPPAPCYWSLILIIGLCANRCVSVSSVTEETAEDWVASCRSVGFDPWQLACKTCEVFSGASGAAAARAKCLECCQSYKDVERITQPYETAVLAIPPHVGEEVQLLLDENWEELQKDKGKMRLLTVEKKVDMDMMGFSSFFSRPPSATILFLENQPSSEKTLDYEDYQKLAKETISLDRWKREDIKDMLSTLLK